jgi:hypothetical protein
MVSTLSFIRRFSSISVFEAFPILWTRFKIEVFQWVASMDEILIAVRRLPIPVRMYYVYEDDNASQAMCSLITNILFYLYKTQTFNFLPQASLHTIIRYALGRKGLYSN